VSAGGFLSVKEYAAKEKTLQRYYFQYSPDKLHAASYNH
jgi:hypothetical protein